MSASVDVVVKQLSNILMVPTSALRMVNNSQVVYVLQNNVAVPLAVTLGAASDTTTQILSGSLKEGDLIITNPSSVTAASTTSNTGLSGLLSGLSNMFTGAAGATGGAGGPPSGGAGGPPSGSPPSGAPSGSSTGGN
jgi:6-phosphogluconate dehydrogenase